jgi:hypothetical protein
MDVNRAAHHRDPSAADRGEDGSSAERGDHPSERWTVDGIEDSPHGPLARLEREDGTTFDLPLRNLPAGLREGDLLVLQDGPDGVSARILERETRERRAAMQAHLETLNSADDGAVDDGEITV